jgi:hypothetical protein
MRKRGEQLAMDVRRGRPELEEPGIAEAEQLAGASRALSARGGITPAGRIEGVTGAAPADVISQHHAQLTDATAQFAQGKMSAIDLKKLFKQFGWQADINGQSIQATDPNGQQHTFGQEAEAQ